MSPCTVYANKSEVYQCVVSAKCRLQQYMGIIQNSGVQHEHRR